MASCNSSMRRLTGELRRIQTQPPGLGIAAGPRGDLFDWAASIPGPEGTPWEGMTLRLRLQFPADYPFHPPEVQFLTPLRHPNVYSDGSVCVDLLGQNWAPACDVCSILITLQQLLTQPNPDSPANVMAGDAFREGGMEGLRRINRDLFESA